MNLVLKIGLAMNFAGTIMACLSVGKNPSGAYQRDDKGNDISLASILHPCVFRWGLILIAIGFLLQLLS